MKNKIIVFGKTKNTVTPLEKNHNSTNFKDIRIKLRLKFSGTANRYENKVVTIR